MSAIGIGTRVRERPLCRRMLTWRRYLPEPAAPDPDPVGQISQRDRLHLSRHVVRRLTRDWRENPMSATEMF